MQVPVAALRQWDFRTPRHPRDFPELTGFCFPKMLKNALSRKHGVRRRFCFVFRIVALKMKDFSQLFPQIGSPAK